jgi:hypothetical protein
MDELLQHLVDQPIPNVIVFVGLALLFVAAVGKITGKIEPDTRGRIASGVLGLILVPSGLFAHRFLDSNDGTPQPQPIPKMTATAASTSSPPKSPSSAARTDRCRPGYVWRLAVPSDHVCVTVEVKDQVAVDNQLAPSRTKNSGPYGADTCLEGFVWRGAVSGDHICVTVETRSRVANDNSLAATRVAP